ncbi:MAG TPA: ABC transporter ATP-binding protein [Candidatus Coproplasma excrementipullorum]|nr:ABC transporter ATP-binding protein [Candidatus Coproplasma excrementipullorum]
MENLEYALQIENLTKSYGNVHAVNGISFSVKKGSLFAFLGVNGAGKSTTINIICSILDKDSGKIYVGGEDLDENSRAIKRNIGIVFQTSVLDKELTVLQNLEIRTAFYGLSKEEKKENINTIIDLLELEPILKRPVKNLSGGQMRRVDIARAMVHRPKLLILDEPTTGLDPKNRRIVWSLIDKIRTETGMTVFLTTHYLEEAELATDVVIMDRGRIIAHGTPNELKNAYSSDVLVSYMDRNEQFESALQSAGYEYTYDGEKCAYRIKIADTAAARGIIEKFPAYTQDIEILKGKMDDVFLNVTGRDITLTEEEDGGKD